MSKACNEVLILDCAIKGFENEIDLLLNNPANYLRIKKLDKQLNKAKEDRYIALQNLSTLTLLEYVVRKPFTLLFI